MSYSSFPSQGSFKKRKLRDQYKKMQKENDPQYSQKTSNIPKSGLKIAFGTIIKRLHMWLTPGMCVKRWLLLFVICVLVWAVGFLHFTWTGPLHETATFWMSWLNSLDYPQYIPIYITGLGIMLLAFSGAFTAMIMLNRSVLHGVGQVPAQAVDTIYERHSLAKGPRIVALGGGTGLSRLLSGLKQHSRNITAVVTVADDGGSSGKLRESLNMIAPGDLTDCYAALSDSPVLARLLLHRFARGEGLEGHTLGNLMLATLSEEQGGLETAMHDIHEALKIRGKVFPATTKLATLIAHLEDGRTIRGESQLAEQVAPSRIERIQLDPPHLPALPAVTTAIQQADLIILGPGSLYTSIIPALLVPETAQAIRCSTAPLVYVASIMTEAGETEDMSLQDHIEAIVRHLGRLPDWILVNNMSISSEVAMKYEVGGATLIEGHCDNPDIQKRLHFFPLAQKGTVYHNPEALALALLQLIE